MPGRVQRLPGPYFVKHGYRTREAPMYTEEHRADGYVWQPDVYRDGASAAVRLGCRRIVDVGCGNGEKLASLHPAFEVVGIDYRANLVRCRELYGFGTWLEHDLESEDPLPVPPELLEDAVVVCADVIEHLTHPERLLTKLAGCLPTVGCILVSTPERDLWWGVHHMGPPPNPAHVREWATGEFVALLAHAGFEHGIVRLTRSNDRLPHENTLLALLFPNDVLLQQVETVP